MAKKKTASKKENKKSKKNERMARVIEQAKEPLGLLEILKEEGMARAGYLLGVAADVASNVTKDSLRTQFKDISSVVGLVTREDLVKINKRLDALEEKIEALAEQLGSRASAHEVERAANSDEGEDTDVDESEDSSSDEEDSDSAADFDRFEGEEFRVRDDMHALGGYEAEEEDE